MNYKEWLQKNNIIAYRILNNSFKNNKIFHSYIFSSQKGQNIENEYLYLIQKLIDKSKNFDPLKYSDLIFLDGSKKIIKKDQVLNAINQLQQTTLDSLGKKILVIKNIENTNIQSLNSLLKFIEEPTKNTYIIMTTNNISSILTTIKSRSQIITVPPINMNDWIEQVKMFNYGKDFSILLANLYKTKKEIDKNFNEDFKKNYYYIIKILKEGLIDKNNFFIEMNNFINKKNWKLNLSFLNLFFNDIWKKNNFIPLSFKKEKKLIQKYINSNFDFQNAIIHINDFFLLREKNLNFELSKINLLLKIGECYE